MGTDRFTLETTAAADGSSLFRGEQTAPDGRLVDATLWTAHPAQAIKDLNSLQARTYWAHQRREDDNHRPLTAV